MRHFFPGAIATLARRVGETTAARGLVAPAGGPLRLPAGVRRASATAVAIAAIAARTDHPRLAAAGTGKQAGDWVQWQIPADPLDPPPPVAGYCARNRATHGLGAALGLTSTFRPSAASVSIGTACLR